MFTVAIAIAFLYFQSADAVACQPGWEQEGNECYLAVPGRTSYSLAEELCGRLGATLVQLKTADEAFFVNMLTGMFRLDKYWLGIKRDGNDWKFKDGTVSAYTNWRAGQPDNCCGGNVVCALTNYANTLGLWDDYSCKANAPTQGYVCQVAAA